MIKARQDSGLAQELLTGFIANFFRESAVVFDLFQSTLSTLQASILGKINGSYSALTDSLTDLVAATQYLPILERWEQSSPYMIGFVVSGRFDSAWFCTETLVYAMCQRLH